MGVLADVVAFSCILSVFEHWRIWVPLGVVGVGGEQAPKLCSGHQFILEGNSCFWLDGVPVFLDPRVPS